MRALLSSRLFPRGLEEITSWLSLPWSGPIVANHVLVSFPDVVINTLTETTQGESGPLGPTRGDTFCDKGAGTAEQQGTEVTLHPQKENRKWPRL